MTDRILHTQFIPGDSQTGLSETLRRRTATAGAVSEGASPARVISAEPGETTVDATYRGARAKMMAKEVAGLLDASDYDMIPYYGANESTDEDGYYIPASASDEPAEIRDEGSFYSVTGTLRKRGTRRSHWRSVTTAKATVDNDFGNDDVAEIGIHDDARLVEWLNARTGETESASAVRTVDGEHATVAIYDVDDSDFDDPTLIFDLPYEREGFADVRVWDDKGESRTDDDGNVLWRKIYDASHDPDGAFVLENDILRLVLNDDDSEQTLDAYRWDEDADEYAEVSLGDSDWTTEYVDVRRIGSSRLRARVRFIDGSGDESYTLVLTLTRGDESALWRRREKDGVSPTPSGLEDLLEPVAKETRRVTGQNDDVIAASEVDS